MAEAQRDAADARQAAAGELAAARREAELLGARAKTESVRTREQLAQAVDGIAASITVLKAQMADVDAQVEAAAGGLRRAAQDVTLALQSAERGLHGLQAQVPGAAEAREKEKTGAAAAAKDLDAGRSDALYWQARRAQPAGACGVPGRSFSAPQPDAPLAAQPAAAPHRPLARPFAPFEQGVPHTPPYLTDEEAARRGVHTPPAPPAASAQQARPYVPRPTPVAPIAPLSQPFDPAAPLTQPQPPVQDAPLAEEEAVIPDSAPIPPARRSAQEDAPHSVQSATAQLLATLNAMLGQD